MVRITVVVVAIALGALAGSWVDAQVAWAGDVSTKEKRARLERRVALLASVRATFAALAAEPAPKNMTAKEKATYEAHTAWLTDGAKRLQALALTGKAALGSKTKFEEAQESFSMQYLKLQSTMQNESRRFTTLANIMKTKHDTASNAISNLR